MRKFMRSFGTASVVLAVVAAGSAPVAWSHSLKDLQTQLGDREKYFQPIDKEGRWRANFHGLQFKPTNLVVFVNALVNDIERPHGHGERSLWDKLKGLFGS